MKGAKKPSKDESETDREYAVRTIGPGPSGSTRVDELTGTDDSIQDGSASSQTQTESKTVNSPEYAAREIDRGRNEGPAVADDQQPATDQLRDAKRQLETIPGANPEIVDAATGRDIESPPSTSQQTGSGDLSASRQADVDRLIEDGEQMVQNRLEGEFSNRSRFEKIKNAETTEETPTLEEANQSDIDPVDNVVGQETVKPQPGQTPQEDFVDAVTTRAPRRISKGVGIISGIPGEIRNSEFAKEGREWIRRNDEAAKNTRDDIVEDVTGGAVDPGEIRQEYSQFRSENFKNLDREVREPGRNAVLDTVNSVKQSVEDNPRKSAAGLLATTVALAEPTPIGELVLGGVATGAIGADVAQRAEKRQKQQNQPTDFVGDRSELPVTDETIQDQPDVPAEENPIRNGNELDVSDQTPGSIEEVPVEDGRPESEVPMPDETSDSSLTPIQLAQQVGISQGVGQQSSQRRNDYRERTGADREELQEILEGPAEEVILGEEVTDRVYAPRQRDYSSYRSFDIQDDSVSDEETNADEKLVQEQRDRLTESQESSFGQEASPGGQNEDLTVTTDDSDQTGPELDGPYDVSQLLDLSQGSNVIGDETRPGDGDQTITETDRTIDTDTSTTDTVITTDQPTLNYRVPTDTATETEQTAQAPQQGTPPENENEYPDPNEPEYPAYPAAPSEPPERPPRRLPDEEQKVSILADTMDDYYADPDPADDALRVGWYAETVSSIATGGAITRAPSESTLEEQPLSLALTGELPTETLLSEDPETKERVEDVQALFFGGSGGGGLL